MAGSMLALLLRGRNGTVAMQPHPGGAVSHHMAGSGAQDEGGGPSGQGPSHFGEGPGIPNRTGDLRCLLPTGPLATPTKSTMLGTPRGGQQKDILLDMARRAQPVIREVEARKHWSVQNAWLESQEERC